MTPPDSSQLWRQIVWLVVLAVPIACVAWTVTHEEVFREPREYCARRSRDCRSLLGRKFFYLFTCEYCFSHYVTIAFLLVARFRLLFDDWRGYLVSFFALVAVANVYMSSFGRLRQEVKSEGLEAKTKEKILERVEAGADHPLADRPPPNLPPDPTSALPGGRNKNHGPRSFETTRR